MQKSDPIKTDYTDLDKIIDGLYPGELMVIGAGFSMGKTSFLASLIKNITWKQGRKGLLFSLSKPIDAFRVYLISPATGIKAIKIAYPEKIEKEKQLKEDEQEYLKMISFEVSNLPLFIDDTEAKNINDLCESARKMIKNNGVEIIFIDNIDYIVTDNATSWSVAQSEIMTKLKQLAKELNVPVIGTTNVPRVGWGRIPPSLDLFQSCINDNADVILLLNRKRAEDFTPIPTDLNIAKNSYGDTGEIKIMFYPKTICFGNMEISSDNEQNKIDGDTNESIKTN